jgi:hypothetical protein
MGIVDNFCNTFETCDHPLDDRLMTHYFRNSYNDVKASVLEIAKVNHYEVDNIDDHYKEIALTGKKVEWIVSMYNSTPLQTSVDFKINTHYAFPFKKPIKMIETFYHELDRRLTLLRKGEKNEF